MSAVPPAAPVVDTGAPESDLRAFRDPASVAVLGASADRAKWGYWLAAGALSGEHRRDVYLINQRTSQILGYPTYRSIGDCPKVPELLVIAVPATQVFDSVRDALNAGTRHFLCITTPIPDQQQLADLIRSRGGRLIGPNSLGLVDTVTSLQLAWGSFAAGSLAVVSHSGQVGTEIAALSAAAGLGISRFISIGNQIDITATEMLDDLVGDTNTRVVALYLESFAQARTLLPVLQALRNAGTPVLVLTLGGSDGSTRLARSHTGSITSTLDQVDALCRAAGALRVRTPGELVEVAQALLAAQRPLGKRVAVLGDSGGQCGLAADVLAAAGLELPVLDDLTQRELAALLPTGAATSNPVDLAGAGEADLRTYAAAARLLLANDQLDAVVLTGYFGSYGVDTPGLASAENDVATMLLDVAAGTGTALLVHSMAAISSDRPSPALQTLRAGAIPVFDRIEALARSVAGAVTLAGGNPRPLASVQVPMAPAPVGYWATRNLLSDWGIQVPAGQLLNDRQEVISAVQELGDGIPLVLKADWIEHKTEVGAIALGLVGLNDVLTSYDDMVGRLGQGRYVLEQQDYRSNILEMIVGYRVDHDLGPMVLVGAGGIFAEMYRDSVIELAPVDHHTALTMIHRLACAPALLGWRGKPAVDINALAAVIVTVSQRCAAIDGLTEFELNPVRVGVDGALVCDALVVVNAPPSPPSNAPQNGPHS